MTHPPHPPQNSEIERVLGRLKMRHIENNMPQISGDMPQNQNQTPHDGGDGGHTQMVSDRYANENVDK